jgi:transcriptional regulator with XRE-family HTH domain
MARRGLNVSGLADHAGIPHSELQALLHGAAPSEADMRLLAPALDLHAADLFAIAWVDVPADLAPLDLRAGGSLPHLAAYAARLSPGQVRHLRDHVGLLPQEERTQPSWLPPPFERFERSPGGVLLRLFANRNLAHRAAYAITGITGRGLSPSTVFQVEAGRKTLSPEELADYITVLDISAAEASIMTGMDLPSSVPQRQPGTVEAAKLIWDVRRLSAEQVIRIRDMAQVLAEDHLSTPAG